jgi:hypothetical protein
MWKKSWLAVLLLLLWTLPALADVIYDFVTTSASGIAFNKPFTDPKIIMTVDDAVLASGSYNYSAQHCLGLAGCLTGPLGDPTGINIKAGLDFWTPLFGSALVNLTFSDDAIAGSIREQGQTLGLTASGSLTEWSGTINSDSLNCVGVCSFTGYWQDTRTIVPEASSLTILLVGVLSLGLVPLLRRR